MAGSLFSRGFLLWFRQGNGSKRNSLALDGRFHNIVTVQRIVIEETAQNHQKRDDNEKRCLAVIIGRVIKEQNIGSVVKMQCTEACIAQENLLNRTLDISKKQQCQSREQITFMHTHGKQEHGNNQKCRSGKIAGWIPSVFEEKVCLTVSLVVIVIVSAIALVLSKRIYEEEKKKEQSGNN